MTLDGEEDELEIAAEAVGGDGLGDNLELVFLAVKSHHTVDALREITPRLAPGGTIVSLQNGLSEELIAKAIGGGRAVGCLVDWAADSVAPGRILHGGHGALVLGALDG